MDDLKTKFPKIFSFFEDNEFAATTFINKYALKDRDGNILEDDPNKTIERVMTCLANSMPTEYPLDEWIKKNNDGIKETWKEIFIKTCGKFNGLVPQGSVLSAAGNEYSVQSLSNCFVINPIHDSISGILKAGEEIANITKRRGGVGLNLSSLRPYDAPVSNAARSSTGTYGFMDLYSNICRSIGQGGRRGALMIALNVKHPDAELFTKAKQDLKYCTGANVSLQITDEFMNAVIKDKKFIQQFPINSKNPSIIKNINARDLWKTICECAWNTGEPGLIFWDQCLKNLPAECYEEFKSISVNPCSEVVLSNDSCRLAALCLTKYVDRPFQTTCSFDFTKFVKDIRIGMRLMDALVSAEIKQIDKIINKIKLDIIDNNSEVLFKNEITMWENFKHSAEQGRRTGLGLFGLGDCLTQLRIKYDSNEALELINNIFKCFRDIAYNESIEMAKEYGPFPAFNWDKEKDCEFIKRLPKDIKDDLQKYGRRNISLLTCSPTGTLAIIAGCSSGMEPSFRFMYLRRRKINSNDLQTKTDFIDELGDKWSHHMQLENNVKLYFRNIGKEIPKNITSDEELMEYLPKYFITSDKINWKRKIEILGTMVQYIDHSISNTTNLPNNVKPELIEELYELAWKKGLKGLTVYRDGSRSGVLLSNEQIDKQKIEQLPVDIQRSVAPKRPDKLPCDVYVTSTNKKEYVVIVGLLNNSAYEVFCGEYDNEIPKKPFNGFVEKKGKGKYILNYIHGTDLRQVDINQYFDNKEHATITRLISMSLRHGSPLPYVIEQLQKSASNMFEFGPSLSRILKKYVKLEDLKETHKTCSKCNSPNILLTHEDGCFTIKCNDCNLVDSKCS